MLTITEECFGGILLTNPLSVRISEGEFGLRRCFTRVHGNEWCSSGLVPFISYFRYLETALSSCVNGDIAIWSHRILTDLECADDVGS